MSCCDHAPGQDCYAHDCCTCCRCPATASAWRAYLRLGGDLPEAEFLALPPGERSSRVLALNMRRVAAGMGALTFS
jgi:hypothetical protein